MGPGLVVRQVLFERFVGFCVEVPNELRLVAERPPPAERKMFRRAASQAALYRAAARLWSKGVDMAEAISIVESAMRDAGEL